MTITPRLLFHNIKRSFYYTNLRRVADSNRDRKESSESVTKDWRVELYRTMKILPNFINEQEESILMQEIDPYMKRLRYEYSHWDNVSKIYWFILN